MPGSPQRPDPRLLFLIPLIAAVFACQAVVGLLQPPPTPTPQATATLTPSPTPTFTSTFTPTPSFTPSATPSPTLTSTETQQPGDTDLHIQVFEQLWNIVAENYLYPDFNGLDWDQVHVENRQKIEAGMSDKDFYALMKEMIQSLGDDHSSFFTPQEANELDASYAGEYDYVGIGVLTVTISERKRVTIIAVFSGSPAEQAGLKVRDSILSADGKAIVDETGFRRDLILGPAGTFVELSVQTPGQEPRLVRVQRAQITGSLPLSWQVLLSPDDKRIGYISLVTFNDSTVDDQFGQALETMGSEAPLDGLIIDNRMNGGGASDVFENVLSFVTNGVMGFFTSRQENHPLSVSGKDIHGSQEMPLVVLVGKSTASFGEIFSGILKDTGRAYLIGEVTDGNVEILRVFNLADGSRAWIAHETFKPLNHPQQDWEQTGIIPDQIVVSSWDEFDLPDDPVIQAALSYFDNR